MLNMSETVRLPARAVASASPGFSSCRRRAADLLALILACRKETCLWERVKEGLFLFLPFSDRLTPRTLIHTY